MKLATRGCAVSPQGPAGSVSCGPPSAGRQRDVEAAAGDCTGRPVHEPLVQGDAGHELGEVADGPSRPRWQSCERRPWDTNSRCAGRALADATPVCAGSAAPGVPASRRAAPASPDGRCMVGRWPCGGRDAPLHLCGRRRHLPAHVPGVADSAPQRVNGAGPGAPAMSAGRAAPACGTCGGVRDAAAQGHLDQKRPSALQALTTVTPPCGVALRQVGGLRRKPTAPSVCPRAMSRCPARRCVSATTCTRIRCSVTGLASADHQGT